MVACRAVLRPPSFSGLATVSILTINLDKGLWEVDADAVMTDAQTVYDSPGHLYVATQRWIDPQTQPANLPTTSTLIHRFDVGDPDRTTYEASGEVPGYLLNQLISEKGCDLRVASPPTRVGRAAAGSSKHVTVLRRHGTTLTPIGRVSWLGTGQRLSRALHRDMATRDLRQSDPLYRMLADPSAPKVLGELGCICYSATCTRSPTTSARVVRTPRPRTYQGTYVPSASATPLPPPAVPARARRRVLVRSS